MRSVGAKGIAEKTPRSSGQTAFYERFNEERSVETPSSRSAAALRLSPRRRLRREAPPGRPSSPDGASREERQSAPLEREQSPGEKRSEGLRRIPPRPAPGALRGGVSPRPPRLDRPPALHPQVADQVVDC
jgi:hypothetical protein